MADINKLKNRARREEQRQNWTAAIGFYTQALRASERGAGSAPDFSLYNRIGDIHLRLGQVDTAIGFYEQAVQRYAEQDLPTSAIALCNKILRIQPARISVYKRLGQLQLETGLLAEARVNYLRHATELLTRGCREQANGTLGDYVERTGDLNSALRFAGALVANDRSEEALELLLLLKNRLETAGGDVEALLRPIAAIQGFDTVEPGASDRDTVATVGELEAEMSKALETRRHEAPGSIALLEAELDAAVGAEEEAVETDQEATVPAVAEAQPAPELPAIPTPPLFSPEPFEKEAAVEDDARPAVPDLAAIELPDPLIAPEAQPVPDPAFSAEGRDPIERAVPSPGMDFDFGGSEEKLEVAGEPIAAAGSRSLAEVESRESVILVGAEAHPARSPEISATEEESEKASLAHPPAGQWPRVEAEEPVQRHEVRPVSLPYAGTEGLETLSRLAASPEVEVFPREGEGVVRKPQPHSSGFSPEETELLGDRGVEWADSEPLVGEPATWSLPAGWDGDGTDGPEAEATEAPVDAEPATDEQPETEGDDSFAVHLQRGIERRERGDLMAAIEEFELATRSASCFVEAYRWLEECRAALETSAAEITDAAVESGQEAIPRDVEPVAVESVLDEATSSVLTEISEPALPSLDEAFEAWLQASTFAVLERALLQLEQRGELRRARHVVERLVEIEASEPAFHRKKIELATVLGEEEGLAQAFLELGEALEEEGQLGEARTAFFRALEYDPDSDPARRAIGRVEERAADLVEQARELEDQSAKASFAEDIQHESPTVVREKKRKPRKRLFVRPPRAKGDRIEPSEPTPAEGSRIGVTPYDRREAGREELVDFDLILAELKDQLAEGVGDESDGSSRTKVGERLRDMGLLDDAIRELQAAVRTPNASPRAYELLGEAFIEKGQARVATRLLSEALEKLSSQEREEKLLGVLYQLGVAHQTTENRSRALECYERIFSVDIDYKDVRERIESCSA